MIEQLGWQGLVQLIAAIGALGTAAVGLVDASKWARGGISNAGYRTLKKGLDEYAPAFAQSIGADWEEVFRAAWLNGRPKIDQLITARNFIRLGLTKDTAEDIAKACNVNVERLQTVAAKISAGKPLDAAEFEAVGRMDASVEARLGTAYERAEQIYRSSAKVFAGAAAIVLALLAWWLVLGGDQAYFGLSLLAGIVAVPVAPVVKDLTSALAASAQTAKALKGLP